MVPGVVEVNSFGGETREGTKSSSIPALASHGLSVREVIEAIEQSSGNAGGGYLERNREQYVIGNRAVWCEASRTSKRFVIGATKDGVPITVAQIGEVRFGAKLRRSAASMNGEGEVVVGVAMMLMGENSRVVTEAVKGQAQTVAASMPTGMRVEPFMTARPWSVVHDGTVERNLLERAALVILVLLLLGRCSRRAHRRDDDPTVAPFAIIVMQARGASGNLMSLGAIDFGLMVDGAVIIIENAVRRLGEARRQAGKPLSPTERLQVVEKPRWKCAVRRSLAKPSSPSCICPSSRCRELKESCFTRWRSRCCSR